MFGDEINAFVSLDLIYEHTEFLDLDLFRLLRKHLDYYFFKIEKRLVISLLGIQIRSTMRHYDHIVEEDNFHIKGKIMPMRLYFDNSYETLLRPWAIDTMLGRGHYYVNGVKISPETYPENDVFNDFPDWLHFGFSDHSRMDYCVNVIESTLTEANDEAFDAAWGHKEPKEHLRENMDFEETQIIKHRIEEIV